MLTTRTRAVTLGLAVVALAACGGSKKEPVYAKDGDTGAPAPATQLTPSPVPNPGDSTTGVSRGTGAPAAAGDTLGAYNKAAGSSGAVPGQPTPGPGTAGQKGATGTRRP